MPPDNGPSGPRSSHIDIQAALVGWTPISIVSQELVGKKCKTAWILYLKNKVLWIKRPTCLVLPSHQLIEAFRPIHSTPFRSIWSWRSAFSERSSMPPRGKAKAKARQTGIHPASRWHLQQYATQEYVVNNIPNLGGIDLSDLSSFIL